MHIGDFMELLIIESTKNRLQANIKGADHTVCNVVVDELWNDSDVVNAAYNVEHPIVADPKILIETKSKDPKKVLVDAIARVKKQTAEFKKQASSAL